MRSNVLFFFTLVVLTVVGITEAACTNAPVLSKSNLTSEPLKSPEKAGSQASNSSTKITCPPIGASAPVAASHGGHRVILSWKASAPADAKHAAASGYCIYRGVKHKDSSPVLVNPIPFPGTACIDDRVENGKKYYYVVRAISAHGVTSAASNEVRAPIPVGVYQGSSGSNSSSPSCREPDSVK